MYYEAYAYNIDTKKWGKRSFETKKKYIQYIESHWKYPGEYNLKYSEGYWNEYATYFRKNNSYPNFVLNSNDFRKFWSEEKEKCQYDGVIIYYSKKENIEYAVPCLYYWYLNYTPIYDKIKKRLDFTEVWDSDLHFFLMILLCILKGKHSVLLKKRQWGSSFKHTSILCNLLWFGDNSKLKIFSHTIVHTENSWVFLEGYRDHLNKYAGWIRGFDPNKFLDWQVRRKNNDGTYLGNMSILKGLSTEKDASKPVGGGVTAAFCEEAGICPNLDKTHEYLLPAVGIGALTTGVLMYAGSVGELTKCEPLKKYIFKPTEYGFIACENRCEGDEELGNTVGFFAPEWWNYFYQEDDEIKRCYDIWGNSNKEHAISIILQLRKEAEEKDPESYRYYVSQRPLNIKEAFDYRKESIFPQAMLQRQDYRIERGDYPYTLHDIERGGDGRPVLKKNEFPEITEYPYNPKKGMIPYGCIKVFEQPQKDPQMGVYFAAVDPIAVDITSTSESLFSVIIYKNIIEEKYTENGEEKIRIHGDKIVASYIGRKKDINTTNEVAELLIELYNAFAVVENNIDNFIRHMISKNKQKYLATKSDLPFLKELNVNSDSHQEYGVRTNATLWSIYINKILEYLKEEIGERLDNHGRGLGKIYGVEKIPDRRLIKELTKFTDIKGNYDQIITFGLVLCLAKSRQMNGLISKIDTRTDIKPNKDLYSTSHNLFRNLETHQQRTNIYQIRKPFRNLR